MSKKLDELENYWTTDNYDNKIYHAEYVEEILAHARALEEAMTILIDVVKSEKPNLSLVHFEKLLE